MKTPSIRFVSFLITYLFVQLYSFGQPPSLVNFRGQLLNSGGQPVTSTVTIDLRVFPAQTGGAQLYLENVGNVEVRNGQYAFQFGTNGSPDFSAVIKQNAETWVELTLDGNALPRQRFVSVPYALSAGSSQITAGSITREMLAPGVLVDGNGSYNTSQGGGASIDNPYGWSGDVVTHSGSSYTVPAGKVLVIVSGDVIKLSTGEAFRQLQSGYSIVPSDTTISSEKGWTGVLNNSIDDITPVIIKDSPFQVPVGKNLVLTSSVYNITVTGKEVGWQNSRFMLIEQGKTINHPDGFHQSALSGYLIDANKSLGSGFGGSLDPSQIAPRSITREMLAPGVLVDGNGSQMISNSGGASIDNPYGWDGVPVLGEQSEYVVPMGKVLIITSTRQGNFFKIEDNSSSPNSKAIRDDSSLPSFIPEGEKIITGSSGWTGFLVNNNNDYSAVNSKGDSYTVPVGKILVMTSSGGDMIYIPSVYGDKRFRHSDSPPSIIPSGTIINAGGAGNGWSGYLTDQAALAKLGSGSSAYGIGFSSPSLSSLFMPYGYDGEVVIGGNTYTVPDGKVLVTSNYHGYVTIGSNSVNSFSRDSSAANDVVILPEKTTFTLTWNSSSAGSGFVGMLFDQNNDFEAVYGGAGYTVPSGKKLYVTSAVGIMRINGNAVSFRPTIGRTPMLLPSQTTFTLDTGPAQMNYGFSGYLVDENKTLGGGISGGGTAPIANASITRDMLSQEVLDEINASITSDRLSPEITQKLNSSGQVSGQIISVPQGTSIPAGYSMISDSRIEWKLESNNGRNGQLLTDGNTLYSFYSTLAFFDKNTSNWQNIANSSPPSNHTNGAATFYNGKIYFVGGPDTNACSIYDPVTSNWSAGPSIPSSLPGSFEATSHLLATHNQLYAFFVERNPQSGTFKQGSTALAYKLDQNGSWTKLQIDGFAYIRGGIAFHKNAVYFFGGDPWTGSNFSPITFTPSFNKYDIDSGEITSLAPLPQGVGDPSGFIYNENLYVLGGMGQFFNYKFSDDNWNFARDLPHPLNSTVSLHSAIIYEGKAWFTGDGLKTYSGTFVPALYAYTETNGSSGSGAGSSIPAPGSVTTSMLNETILKYLKPEISQQPLLNGQAINSQSISLSAQAEGKYLTYQWKKNGINLNGETNATLTISDMNASQHDGNYTLVVTNDFGSVETTSIPVNVLARQTHTIDLNASQQRIYAYEDKPAGMAVGVLVTDAQDNGVSNTYSLLNNYPDESNFSIRGNILYSADVFDFESKSAYEIGIEVESLDGFTTTTHTLNIRVARDYSGKSLVLNAYGKDLRGVNMRGFTLLPGSRSYGANLSDADLTDANFTGRELEAVNFTGANLTRTILTGSWFSKSSKWPEGFDYLNAGMNGPGIDYSGKSLVLNAYGKDLRGVNMRGFTLLPGSRSYGANLSDADLTDANFSGAELESANFTGTNLTGANLSNARINQNTNFTGALYSLSTIWPVGFDTVAAGAILSHTADLNSTVNLEMLWVEPGTFTMGSPTTEAGRQADREDEHNVSLTKGFYLGKYEVTQAQYQAVMTGNTNSLSATPSEWANNPNRPVEKVSWVDAQIFLTRLNSQQSANIPAGWGYVLPTESQWEYACRAGTSTVYSWGDDINATHANYSASGLSQTRDVAQYSANPWGFFDMHGNVWEWTADWYGATYPTGNPVVDPTGEASGSIRVFRGGSWMHTGEYLRSAERTYDTPSFRSLYVGFRVGFQQVQPDTASPELELVGGGSITSEAGQAWVEPGVSAQDTRDGNLSSSVTITGTVDMNTTGTYVLTYTVADAAGNEANATRTVTVVDTTYPVLTLLGDTNMTLVQGTAWVDPGATASDTLDGNLTGSVTVTGTVDMYSTGTYVLTYTVADAGGNQVIANRVVNVEGLPDITFTVSGGEFSAPYFNFTDGNGQTPDFTTRPLISGKVYEFTASGVSISHPFMIGESYGDTSSTLVNGGPLTGSGGKITVTIPSDYNGSLYYFCTNHTGMNQEFTIQKPTHTTDLNSTVNLEMLWVEPGTFTMGSPTTEAGRGTNETEHNVTLTQGFYLGKYEVTQAQYEAVMTGNTDGLSTTPSEWPNNPNRPVEKVSWVDAQIFLTRLNSQQSANIPTGWAYVLPTESQWEYACRAGTSTVFSWGGSASSTQANFDGTQPYGGAATGVKIGQTSNVGQYAANQWGFFDMHGNVWEWTADWYGATYPTGNPLVDPTGEASGSYRVSRGGSWSLVGPGLRSARRHSSSPSYRANNLGFRVGFQKQ